MAEGVRDSATAQSLLIMGNLEKTRIKNTSKSCDLKSLTTLRESQDLELLFESPKELLRISNHDR